MKKQIKRILAIILLLVLGMNINVNAATASSELNASKLELNPGDTFEVIFSVSCEEGINGVTGKISYDTEKLELVNSSVTDTEKYLDFGEELTLEIMNRLTDTIKSDDIYKLTFKVKEDVEVETTAKVSITEIKINSDMGNDFDLKEDEITISIKERSSIDEEPTDTPSEEPSEEPTDTPNEEQTDTPSEETDENPSEKPSEDSQDSGTDNTEDNQKDNSSNNNGNGTSNSQNSTVNKTTTGEDISTKELPYTGSTTIIISILALGVISGISYFSYRKYKNI